MNGPNDKDGALPPSSSKEKPTKFHRRTASAIAKITQSVSKLRLHNRQKSSSQFPQKSILRKGEVLGSDGRGIESSRTVSYVGSSSVAGSQYRHSTSRYLDLDLERQRGLIKATPDLLAASVSLMASEGTVQDVAWFISSIKLSALSEQSQRFESPESDKTFRRKREDQLKELWMNSKHRRMWTTMIHDLESALATRDFELAVDHLHNLQSLLDEISKATPTGVRSKEGKLAISLELEVAIWKSRVVEEVQASLQMQRLAQAPIPLLKLLSILASPVDCVEALIKIYEKRINVDKDLFAGQGLKILSTTASRPEEFSQGAVKASMDLGLTVAAALSEAFDCLKMVYAGNLQQMKATKKSDEVANSLLGAWALELVRKEAGSFHTMIYHLSTSSSGLNIALNCAVAFVAPIKMVGRKLGLPLESVVNSATWSACEHAFQRKIRQVNDNLKKLGSQDAAALISRLGQAGSLNTPRMPNEPNEMEWQTYFPSAARLKNEVGSLYKVILPLKCLTSIKSFRNGVSSLFASYGGTVTNGLIALETTDPGRKGLINDASILVMDMLTDLVQRQLAEAVRQHEGLESDSNPFHRGFGVPLDAVALMQVVVKASDALKMDLHQVSHGEKKPAYGEMAVDSL